MAKRRRSSTRTRTVSGTTKIIRMNAPAPIIRVAAPRASPVRRRGRSRRRSSSSGGGGGGLGGIVSNESMQLAIGGALYGYAVKQGIVAKLPALPFFGRTGTAAILLDYWSRHGGGNMVHKAARAAAAIAGYQLGAEGAIQGEASTPVEGDDMDGYDLQPGENT
jgi:hypothetical protein